MAPAAPGYPSPRQPSLFAADVADPRPADLVGLLAGPGQGHRLGGTARVRVTVAHGWRVHVLVAELARRSLAATWEPTAGGFTVQTPYTTLLVPLVRHWEVGAPTGLHLAGAALRLWVAAAGGPDPEGYLLGTGKPEATGWPRVAAALAAAGLPGARVSAGGAYRITGRRALARLAELVGDPPEAVPAGMWPGVGAVDSG